MNMSNRRSARIGSRTSAQEEYVVIDDDESSETNKRPRLSPPRLGLGEQDVSDSVEETIVQRKKKKNKKRRNRHELYPCMSCKTQLQAEISAALEANPQISGVDVDILKSLGLSTAGELVQTCVDFLNCKKVAALSSPVKREPILITKTTLESHVLPRDPAFFVSASEPLNPPPHKWQLFSKPFLWDPEKEIPVCNLCRYEAVLSSDGLSFLCPGRNRFGAVKDAQNQGCFALSKTAVMRHAIKFQEEVLAFNSAPPPPTFESFTKGLEDRTSIIHKRNVSAADA
jgi:hypothetical protein